MKATITLWLSDMKSVDAGMLEKEYDNELGDEDWCECDYKE